MKKQIFVSLLIVTVFAATAVAVISYFGAKERARRANLEIEERFQLAVEDQYPAFKHFEQQKSFAGREVRVNVNDKEFYYTYIENGSGVPIVKATCFRVDRIGRIYQVGEFPDPADSYLGYSNIDPQTCLGIK